VRQLLHRPPGARPGAGAGNSFTLQTRPGAGFFLFCVSEISRDLAAWHLVSRMVAGLVELRAWSV
jgi:hypothetical protein